MVEAPPLEAGVSVEAFGNTCTGSEMPGLLLTLTPIMVSLPAIWNGLPTKRRSTSSRRVSKVALPLLLERIFE